MNTVNTPRRWNSSEGIAMVDPRKLILYIVHRYASMTNRGIGGVRLMKLLFLVDYEYYKRFGVKLMDIEWRMWLFGPFSKKVLDALDDLELSEELFLERTEGGSFLYYIMTEPPKLDNKIKSLIDEILERSGKKPLEDLLKEVYSIKEVSDAKPGDIIL